MKPSRRALLLACLALCAAAPAPAPKQPFCGLLTMGRPRFQKTGEDPDNTLKEVNAHPGVYVGAALLVKWSQLQPRPGGLETAAIDDGLAAMRRYNQAHPATPIAAKLRVFTGPSAPGWAKALDGGPVTVLIDDRPYTIGRFWAPAYHAAWQTLQRLLAARYDADPLVREVAASSCSVATAEPFGFRVFVDSAAAVRAAGFSDAAFAACLRAIPDDYAPWQATPIDFTFETFHRTDGPRPQRDPDFTLGLMRDFRARYGTRAVLATHGARVPLPPGLLPIYDTLRALGPPVELQTLQPKIDLDAAVRLGQSYGATEIEMWDSVEAGGPAAVTMPMLQSWSGGFRACQARRG